MKIGWKPPPPPPPPPPAPAPRAAPPPAAPRTNTAFQAGNTGAARMPSLDGTSASSLRTERLGDGRANCLENAVNLSRPEDQIVLLADGRDGVGHALVRHPDGTVTDPNQPNVTWNSLGQWQAMNPGYTDPRSVPAGQLKQALSVPPGPQRDEMLAKLGMGGVANRMVADEATGVSSPVTGNVTVKSDGNVTFTQEAQLEPASVDFERGRISGSLSAGPLAQTEVSLSWNPTQPRPDGTYEVTASYSATVGVQAEGELALGPFGVSAGVQSGTQASNEYTLYLTGDQLAQLGRGEYALPSIADPLGLPEGGSIVMSTGDFRTQEGSISYGPLELGSESTQTEAYSVGVERTGQSSVRVTVGPTETVEQRLSLGLSFGDVASVELGRDRSLETGNTVSVEFDLSTPQGQQAYQSFLTSGQLPTQEGPGVSGLYQEQTLNYEGGLSAGLSIGDVLNLEHQFWTEDMKYTTHTEDGVTSVTANGHTSTGQSFEVSWSQNADGTHTLNSVTMGINNPGGDPVTLQLTGSEGVQSMQDAAVLQMQQSYLNIYQVEWRGPVNGKSDEEVVAYIRANHPPGSPEYQLTLQPGEPGYSPSAFLEAWRAVDDGSYPLMPNLTLSLLEMPQPPDLSMGASLFFGLNGIGLPNQILDPSDGSFAHVIPSYFEIGLQNMPGVHVEGLPQ